MSAEIFRTHFCFYVRINGWFPSRFIGYVRTHQIYALSNFTINYVINFQRPARPHQKP